MIYEIEYKDTEGNMRFCDVEGHAAALVVARQLAKESGKRTTIRKAPQRDWRLFVADLSTGQLLESRHLFTKTESIKLWRQWKDDDSHTALIFWPKLSKFLITLTADAE
jgi:hypothetical protein